MNLNEIIAANKKLIYSIIYRFKGEETDDLFQVGCIGLIKAYNNFDNSKNTKFTSYAYLYIVGEIYDYLNHNKLIKSNHKNVQILKKIKKAEEYLTQQLNRVPTENEIATFLEISPEEYNEIINSIYIESLDYEKDNKTLLESIESYDDEKETLIMLKEALNKLSHEEKEIIVKRYFYNISQNTIAKELMVNQVKVSRYEKKILHKMRTFMT